ncbi:hypothetical protein [Egbenema bharatensis]|uniref:hypothetical protein n=1 Tax=Egbenema bharatensis TaxID=3463334 RepID=UPI003A89D12C
MGLQRAFADSFAAKPARGSQIFWFSLTLTVAAIYSILYLQIAFGGEYVVQDDARQHVFWMRRFLEPGLFPDNLIADYFQSVAPWGYTHFYRLFALLGIDPMLLAKLLPVALGLIAAGYGYFVSWQLLPAPLTSFLSSVMIQQVIWTHDDVASATPRAFMPALFLAFLYYLLKRRLVPLLVTIALEGLFYPQYVFVFAGLLVLQPLRWQEGKLRLSQDKKDYWFCAAGLAVAVLVMLPYALTASDFGPTITAAEARELPEFNAGGRSRFFYDDRPLHFWFADGRSGLFPAFRPATLAIGILLPLLMRFPNPFPLARQITPQIRLLLQIIIVALFWFFAAHLVLFKLHLPSRYTAYTLRYVLAFSTAFSFCLIFEGGLRSLQRSAAGTLKRFWVWGIAALAGTALLIYPNTVPDFPRTNHMRGRIPEIYEYLAQQPKDTLIAGATGEVDNIPSFTNRSVLFSREYAIPYHVGYANQFRQRVEDFIQAQYSRDPAELANFIRTYGVDYLMIPRSSFNPDYLEANWIRQYPDAIREARANLEQGRPVLRRMINPCTIVENAENEILLLGTQCILEAIE